MHLEHLRKYKNIKVLVAPLNWGLGHATRCIPIIDYLCQNNEVIIASDGLALSWLELEYPNLEMLELPGYQISYDSNLMWLNMLKSSPNLISAIRREHQLIQELVTQEGINLVISDHRLGLYTDLCETAVIAHQIMIPHNNPILRGMISRINKRYLNLYDEVWIPDYEDRSMSLAGNISTAEGITYYRYIGPSSRLEKDSSAEDIELLIILSGPEPSRTELEEKLISIIAQGQMPSSITMIRGTTTSDNRLSELKGIEVIDLADTEILQNRIIRSKHIICRAGYSSIMDLHQVNKSAILIPTPSQPEQEYLGTYHQEKGTHQVILQSDLEDELLRSLKKVLG